MADNKNFKTADTDIKLILQRLENYGKELDQAFQIFKMSLNSLTGPGGGIDDVLITSSLSDISVSATKSHDRLSSLRQRLAESCLELQNGVAAADNFKV
ncbi:MAG: hypothetical protein LBH87_02175 [Coriobacteriales bacterium]|jgi:hypothetical protein|nr:hypothetical protein [Coriobacteriales bacterium]